LWLLLGRGPRRSRAYHRARRLLENGAWPEALTICKQLQAEGALSSVWDGRLRSTEGECYHTAADAALREQHYEESWQHYQAAADLLSLDPATLRQRVVETMLAEARRLFATGSAADLASTQALLTRALQLQPACPEASFWLGLCHVRTGEPDLART